MKNYDLIAHTIFEVCQQYDTLDSLNEFVELKKKAEQMPNGQRFYDRVKALTIVNGIFDSLNIQGTQQEINEMVDSLLFLVKNREEVWNEYKQHITIN